MLNFTITTSTQTVTFAVAIPGVEDNLELHYGGCAYCDQTFRKETIISKIGTEKERKFCAKKHRSLYEYHELAKAASL